MNLEELLMDMMNATDEYIKFCDSVIKQVSARPIDKDKAVSLVVAKAKEYQDVISRDISQTLNVMNEAISNAKAKEE